MVKLRLIDLGGTLGVFWEWRGERWAKLIRLPFSLSLKTWKYGVKHGGWLKAIRGGGFV
jgi:hypothetical protein